MFDGITDLRDLGAGPWVIPRRPWYAGWALGCASVVKRSVSAGRWPGWMHACWPTWD